MWYDKNSSHGHKTENLWEQTHKHYYDIRSAFHIINFFWKHSKQRTKLIMKKKTLPSKAEQQSEEPGVNPVAM